MNSQEGIELKLEKEKDWVSKKEIPGWKYHQMVSFPDDHQQAAGPWVFAPDQGTRTSLQKIVIGNFSLSSKKRADGYPVNGYTPNLFLTFDSQQHYQDFVNNLPCPYKSLMHPPMGSGNAYYVNKNESSRCLILPVGNMKGRIIQDLLLEVVTKQGLLTREAALAFMEICGNQASDVSEIDDYLADNQPDEALRVARLRHEEARAWGREYYSITEHHYFPWENEDIAFILAERFLQAGDLLRAIQALSYIESGSPLYLAAGLQIEALQKQLPCATQQEKLNHQKQSLSRIIRVLADSHGQVEARDVQRVLQEIEQYCVMTDPNSRLFPDVESVKTFSVKYVATCLAKSLYHYHQNLQEGIPAAALKAEREIERIIAEGNWVRTHKNFRQDQKIMLRALTLACGFDPDKDKLFVRDFYSRPEDICIVLMDKLRSYGRDMLPFPDNKEVEELLQIAEKPAAGARPAAVQKAGAPLVVEYRRQAEAAVKLRQGQSELGDEQLGRGGEASPRTPEVQLEGVTKPAAAKRQKSS